MRCIVTGCAGFIGSHLTESLLKEHEVTGIDCFTDYYPREIKEANMRGFRENPRFEFLEQDILKSDLREIIKDVDIVYHLAAQAGVRASWGESFRIYSDNNVLATQRLLETCRNSDIKKFVYSSSSSVYGDVEVLPMKETDTPRPISPYGVTKLAGEHLCRLYFKNFGVPALSMRYFTVYGPRQRPDMAFNKFARLIREDKPIRIFGDGNQTRDFTFVSDIVDGTILGGEKGEPGEVYNIGGGSRIPLREVIRILEDLMGKPVKTEHEENKKGDVRDTYSDIIKAKEQLGYNPDFDIKKGLKRYLETV